MSKKKKESVEEIGADYYKLNTKAVDDLLEANREGERLASAPKAEVEEITVQNAADRKKYQKGFLSKLPVWLKALFVKYWFSGAMCFFFYVGLGIYLAPLDLLFVLWLATGVLTDILLNNMLRFFNGGTRDYDKYMMLPMKKFWTFFVNIIYAGVVLALVVMTYQLINTWVISAKGLPVESVPLGVEPLLYGLFYLLYDMIFISVKNLIVKAVGEAKRNV